MSLSTIAEKFAGLGADVAPGTGAGAPVPGESDVALTGGTGRANAGMVQADDDEDLDGDEYAAHVQARLLEEGAAEAGEGGEGTLPDQGQPADPNALTPDRFAGLQSTVQQLVEANRQLMTQVQQLQAGGGQPDVTAPTSQEQAEFDEIRSYARDYRRRKQGGLLTPDEDAQWQQALLSATSDLDRRYGFRVREAQLQQREQQVQPLLARQEIAGAVEQYRQQGVALPPQLVQQAQNVQQLHDLVRGYAAALQLGQAQGRRQNLQHLKGSPMPPARSGTGGAGGGYDRKKFRNTGNIAGSLRAKWGMA